MADTFRIVEGAAMGESGSVQSLERAFSLLEQMAEAGGTVGVSELAERTGLALPTIHRLIRTLVELGAVRQEPDRKYSLGSALLRFGDVAGRRLGSWARPYLSDLVHELGETSNLAILDGDEIVYVAQAPSLHSVRMFTEVGRRVSPHCTAVGKAILSHFSDPDVREILGRTGLKKQTKNSITSVAAFMDDLALTRRRGFALDNAERELGVRCVAVAIPRAPVPSAISISGPESRVTLEFAEKAASVLQQTARTITQNLLGNK